MIVAVTRDAARLFLELGTVTVVLAVGARLAARSGFSSIPLYLIAGVALGALAPPTLDDALVTTLSEVGIVLLAISSVAKTATGWIACRASTSRRV
jgi:K+:H+ antiporter subunit KhtU